MKVVLPFMVALGVVLYLAVWGLYEVAGPPPCQEWGGNTTGTQVYEGQRIECFHGQVVDVAPRRG